MANILNIETSTTECSVALSSDLAVIWNDEGVGASEKLGTFVEQALYHLDREGRQLDAVAVSIGPGSYTGLRIGLSMAKGICYGRNVPLIAVPTLEIQCVPLLLGAEEMEDDALVCSMIDARRMEVYAQIYDRALKTKREAQADIVTEETYREWLDRGPVYFVGNGAEKCQEVITHGNAHFVTGITPLARYMLPLSVKRFVRQDFADVAYTTPFYLKEYKAALPKSLLTTDKATGSTSNKD